MSHIQDQAIASIQEKKTICMCIMHIGAYYAVPFLCLEGKYQVSNYLVNMVFVNNLL